MAAFHFVGSLTAFQFVYLGIVQAMKKMMSFKNALNFAPSAGRHKGEKMTNKLCLHLTIW